MLVDVSHVLGQSQVVLRVTLVPDQPEKVESRQEGRWQLYVGLC